MSAEEATVNTDGTSTFDETQSSGNNNGTNGGGGEDFDEPPILDTEEIIKAVKPAIDPAVYFLLAVIIMAGVYYYFVHRKKSTEDEDTYFSNLESDKFKMKLPSEVDEYYIIKEKCEAAGWEPGQGHGTAANATGPSRVLAQALMKRAVADIPIVTHVQKESGGMNKLYSQSMVSANQWRSYQAAESMVSSEVDEVRAEADEIEPGWSQSIWRQAMQYHQVLKQKHEQELKAAEEQAKKKKDIEERIQAAKAEQASAAAAGAASPTAGAASAPSASLNGAAANTPKSGVIVEDEAERARLAEKAAEELLKMDEREKASKKAFSSNSKGMKKGFLDNKGKKKK